MLDVRCHINLFKMSWSHDTKYILLDNLENKHNLLNKFSQFM